MRRSVWRMVVLLGVWTASADAQARAPVVF
jgi:hypothetical protein